MSSGTIIAFLHVTEDGNMTVVITHTWSEKYKEKLVNLLEQQAIPYDIAYVSNHNISLSSASITDLDREIKESLGWYD